MAECNYDEVTHSIYPPENPDPMYHWDSHFPDRLSRLHLSLEFSSPVFRRNRNRAKERCSSRYKTQPITFDEIKEVDEDTSVMTSSGATQEIDVCREAKTASFRKQLPGYSRSVDGLVMSGYLQAKTGVSTGSDKENSPCDPTIKEDQMSFEAVPVFPFDTSGSGDVVRHRRKRSGRKLSYRNTVQEEIPETDKMEESIAVEKRCHDDGETLK